MDSLHSMGMGDDDLNYEDISDASYDNDSEEESSLN